MDNNNKMNKLILNFNFEGKVVNKECHMMGIINDTYFIECKKSCGNTVKYVIQKINTDVFKKPVELMSNITNVTEHISSKVKELGGNPLRESLNLVKTKNGESYCEIDGEYWRAFHFIENAQTYMMVQKPEDFYTCGKAIGKFQSYLNDFDASKLYETIPDFHNTFKRYNDFLEAVQADKVNRVKDVKAEIDFIMTRAEETKLVVDLIASGELPLKVTHNDTKYNNIMIDNETGEGICVIDLDTVMPGSVLYDFGDAIRSGASTAEEDETDLNKVNFDINLFKLFTTGFLETVGSSLTEKEIELLPFSCKLITLELAMRFLTDYLDGDNYFKVSREHHNLDRTRNQLKLASDMENSFDEMMEIVANCVQ